MTSVGSSAGMASSKLQPETQPKYRILVVDDDASICRMIAVNLQKAGLEFHCATNGDQALRGFEEHAPHLVLLDLMLPGLNGFDVCQTIRKKSQVPVIMMTARVETTHQMRGFRLGADDYVLKPFDPQILVARVIAHLRRTYRYDHGSLHLRDAAVADKQAASVQAAPVQERVEASSRVPEGWAGCGACSYMGPLEKFPRRYNGHGQNVLTCPHCGVERMVQFVVD